MRETDILRLLVIEDNPGDFIILEHFLIMSKLPFASIKNTTSIADTLQFLEENFVDFIFLDLNLPDSHGLETFEQVNQRHPHIPIIVLSGLADINIALESIALGAQDYLVKGEFDDKGLKKSVQYSLERKKIMENLKISNERFELVSKASNEVIWDWDIENDLIHRNGNLCQVFGYAETETTIKWTIENIHPDDSQKVYESIQANLNNRQSKWEAEYRFRCKDGLYREVFDKGYILFRDNGKPYRMIGAMSDVTERKRLSRELEGQRLSQQKMITEITMQAQEKERNELGRELHDNINQILATVKLYLDMTTANHGSNLDLMGKCKDHLGIAMEEIRKLSHSLVAPSLGDMGLVEALKELVDENNEISNTEVHLIVDDDFDKDSIDKQSELVLYRIVQEQLQNIRKYARARHVLITMSLKNESLFLSIIDDGVGFDTSVKSKGIGLKNISSRLEFYSGSMKIISAPGAGCTLDIAIPLLNKISSYE